MASEGYNVTAIDIDNEILEMGKYIEKEVYGVESTNFIKQSIFELEYDDNSFDLCFSVGVLEHFSDDEIIETLSKQIKISKKTIVVIPTKWFNDKEALHGDDRFLSLAYWRNLIIKSDGKIIAESSYPFKGKGFSSFQRLKRIFRPKAYRIFVINSSN